MHHCATMDQATCWSTHILMLNMTTSTNVLPKVQSTMTSEAATRNLHSLAAKLYLSSMMPGICGSLPSSSAKPRMAPTWSKLLVVGSTDVLMTTFENVIWMPSNQTHAMKHHLHQHQLLPPRQWNCQQLWHLQHQHQLHQQLHCKLHAKLEPLWARQTQLLLSYANQLKAWSHHLGFLKRYRPRLSLTDELDDAITQNAPGRTAEVLYP